MFKRPQRHDVLSLNPIDEIVGVTFGATSAQSHFAERAGKFAGAAGDGQHGVTAVIERPLDRQLALIQAQSPEAFQAFPGTVRKQMPWSVPILFLSSAL